MSDPTLAPGAAIVIAKAALPVEPARAFALFTEGEELSRWFCDAASSDPRVGGEVHAAWLDEEGQSWDRIGHWSEFEAPHFATLEWFDGGDATERPPEEPETSSVPDRFRFAVTAHPQGSMVTVASPLPPTHASMRQDVLQDAVQKGWQQTLAALAELLRSEED